MKDEKDRPKDSAHGTLSAAQQKEHHKRQTDAAEVIERQQRESRGEVEPGTDKPRKGGNVGGRVAYREGTGATADVAANDAAHKAGPVGTRAGGRQKKAASKPQRGA